MEKRLEKVKATLTQRELKCPERTILAWFWQCEQLQILPWNYDLKREIFYQINVEDSGIERLFNEWAGNYYSPLYQKNERWQGFFNVETEDCELMQCIYELLWKHRSKYASENSELIDADIMNSFWTPYKRALEAYNKVSGRQENKKLLTWQNGAYQKEAGDFQELLDHLSDEGYKEINEAFESFAKMTHTLGNCTLVPYTFNQVGHQDGQYSWGEALYTLSDSKWQAKLCDLLPENTTGNYYEQYKKLYLLTDNSKESFGYDDADYLHKVVASISLRGQLMVKLLCQKLVINHPEIKAYAFYQQLI